MREEIAFSRDDVLTYKVYEPNEYISPRAMELVSFINYSYSKEIKQGFKDPVEPRTTPHTVVKIQLVPHKGELVLENFLADAFLKMMEGE